MSAFPTGVLGLHDPDIGACDECGTEDGQRRRTMVTRTFGGELRRCMAWLCDECRCVAWLHDECHGTTPSDPIRSNERRTS